MLLQRIACTLVIALSVATLTILSARPALAECDRSTMTEDEWLDCEAAEAAAESAAEDAYDEESDFTDPEDEFEFESETAADEAAAEESSAGSAATTTTTTTTTSTTSSSNGTSRGININTEYNDILDQGIIFANICSGSDDEDCPCRKEGKCSVEQVLQVFVNVSYFILAISGTAALIAFMYGGFEWVIAAGYPERIKRGKAALTGAAVGLAIIFGSYAFINLIIGVLRATSSSTDPIPTGSIENTIGNDANDVIQSR